MVYVVCTNVVMNFNSEYHLITNCIVFGVIDLFHVFTGIHYKLWHL